MLAALAIVAGGVTVGVGGAGAVSTGSTGVPQCDPYGGAQVACDNDTFWAAEQRVGDFRMSFAGSDELVVGQNAWLSASFSVGDAGPQASLPDAAVTNVTFHTPKGFEFVGVSLYSYTPNFYPEPTIWTSPDSTAVVDPVNGDVTVTAPADGWAVATRENGAGSIVSGQVTVRAAFKATELVADGTSGVTFTGTGVPASEGWMATGATQVIPVDLSGFGSLG
ncbi:hypothetical protein [Rhodococcus tukisamuensis]|uniref:hypothetical protein n=1 Tax=Rhodococcus tukisamuensis TaxID=168276 RepID=UPI001113E0C8|nr:hypothetical protein [Rhodococcus tukisamuensis]